jgi:hypothetical protein
VVEQGIVDVLVKIFFHVPPTPFVFAPDEFYGRLFVEMPVRLENSVRASIEPTSLT